MGLLNRTSLRFCIPGIPPARPSLCASIPQPARKWPKPGYNVRGRSIRDTAILSCKAPVLQKLPDPTSSG